MTEKIIPPVWKTNAIIEETRKNLESVYLLCPENVYNL